MVELQRPHIANRVCAESDRRRLSRGRSEGIPSVSEIYVLIVSSQSGKRKKFRSYDSIGLSRVADLATILVQSLIIDAFNLILLAEALRK